MDVVSLAQLFLPQHQLRFECPHVGFHVRDEHVTSLQIQVKFVKVRADISEEAELTETNLVRELLIALEAPLTRVAVEMGIPIWMGMGIVVIPWEFSYGNPMGIPMGIPTWDS